MAHIRSLNKDLQNSAIEELNEVPSRINEDLTALKEWILQQPHLRANMDDQFLIAFLRGCKFSLAKVKNKIDMYYTLKSEFSKEFGSVEIDSEKFREFFRTGMFLSLPMPLNDNGPRIVLIRNGVYDAKKFSIDIILIMALALIEMTLQEDDCATVNGIVVVFDFEKNALHHFMQWTPMILKKLLVFLEEAIPLRIRSVHFIHAPNGFEAFYNIIKPMVSEKLRKKFFIHGNNIDTFYNEIPLKYLPRDYGGENDTIENNIKFWDEKLNEYREYYKKAADYGTDENLRLGKAINFNNIFGIEGSFRKLEVD